MEIDPKYIKLNIKVEDSTFKKFALFDFLNEYLFHLESI